MPIATADFATSGEQSYPTLDFNLCTHDRPKYPAESCSAYRQLTRC